MTDQALSSLLRPQSVAVIGASDNPFVFSGATVYNLREHGFTGSVYPVNPGRDVVQGLKCYSSVLDIPEVVDTAVITVPAAAALDVLQQCEQAGLRSATVVSAGFGEEGAGEVGKLHRERLEHFIANSKMRVLGPNTAGLINLLDAYVPRAAANHLPADQLRAGSVALITQSGACSNIVFNRAQAHSVGVGLMCATGDESDIDVWDLAAYALRDDRIRVLMMITESLGNVSKIAEVAAQAAILRKPILILKLGSSELGSAVVLTHTGSIAGDAAVSRQAYRHWGLIEVADFDEMWEAARIFETWGTPDDEFGSVGIFAFSGGEAALIADHADQFGLSLPAPSADFQQRVNEQLAYAKAANPFDATGELVGRPEKLTPVLDAFLRTNPYTEVLIATPVYRAEAAERILPSLVELLDQDSELSRKRIAISMWPAGEFTTTQQRILKASGCPVVGSSPRTVGAIARYLQYRELLCLRAQASPPDHNADSSMSTSSAETPPDRYFDVRNFLAGAGIPFSDAELVQSEEEAIAAVSRIGYPVVLKGNASSTIHKAAAGLVRLGIATEAKLRVAYRELKRVADENGGSGVVVEAMAYGSLQAIVGARRDPQFGPVIVFGLGGSAADFLNDSAIGMVADFNKQAALELMSSTRIGSFLTERNPELAHQIAAMLTDLGRWFVARDQVAEVDLNPLLIDTTSSRFACVDGRILATD